MKSSNSAENARQEAVSAAQWDAFVDSHPNATLYHTWRWTEFGARVFDFPLHRLVSRDAHGGLRGVLPLILQRSLLFGRRMVSMPFFNYGGPLGVDADVESSLLDEAAELAQRERIQVLEIRDQVARTGRATRLDKVTVDLELPATAELLDKALGGKRRARIRRCERENPQITVGGAELAPAFYEVFAATMRDLGTPVYPQRFFRELLEQLGQDCSVVVIRIKDRVAAAALMTHYRDRTEIPWSAGLHELRETSVNMRLYWECLKLAIGRGSRWFDFGRCSVDSGTYEFKLSWGGKPRQLHWTYPLEQADAAPKNSGGLLRTRATSVWTRLPRPVATALGSIISPGLPW